MTSNGSERECDVRLDTRLRLELPWEKVEAFCAARGIKPEGKEIIALVQKIDCDVEVVASTQKEEFELVIARTGWTYDAKQGADMDAEAHGDTIADLLKLFGVDLREVMFPVHTTMDICESSAFSH